MPILFSKHGADRRQRDFRRRADGLGREIVSQEKQRKSRKQTADASYYGLGTQVFLIAFGARTGKVVPCRTRKKSRER